MARVIPGRFTAKIDDPFVVFLIGFRVNRLFAVRKWVPTALAMAAMLRDLGAHPEKGLLGVESIFYWRGAAFVQYWRSFEDLERFARSPTDPHLEPWRRFNRSVGTDGSVGIWHRDLSGRAGRVGGRLQQHAGIRSGEGDGERPRGRTQRDRPAPPRWRQRARGTDATQPDLRRAGLAAVRASCDASRMANTTGIVPFWKNYDRKAVLRAAQLAEDLGYDSIWIPEAWAYEQFQLLTEIALAHQAHQARDRHRQRLQPLAPACWR